MKNRNDVPIIPTTTFRSTIYRSLSSIPWKFYSRFGFASFWAGAITLIFGGEQSVRPNERDELKPSLPHQGKGLQPKRKTGFQRRLEFLRRQSEFRLPLEKKSYSTLEPVAVPDDCPGAIIPPGTYTAAAPYSVAGNTAGANDTVSNFDGGYYYSWAAGPDHIYTFTLTEVGPSARIVVTSPIGPYSRAIYLLNGLMNDRCPSGTDNLTFSFRSARADINGTSHFFIDQAPLNVPLHLVVDSTSNAGPYTFKLEDATIGTTIIPPEQDAPVDLNADGKSDFAIVRNTGGGPGGQFTWFSRTSSSQFLPNAAWGVEGDVPISGDFDGDGKDDIAVWRPGAQGWFYFIQSRDQTIRIEDFGQTGDDPTVVSDYNLDGIDDLAVYRAGAMPGAQSYWYYRSVGGNWGHFAVEPWGEYGDRPVPGYWNPYIPLFVVQRPDGQDGRFLVRWGPYGTEQFNLGQADDILVPGDYDGDNFTDIAVVRPTSDGFLSWTIRPMYGGPVAVRTWGVAATDQIVQGDYNGDGRADLAVWRPGDPGKFYIMSLNPSSIDVISWGQTGDIPVAGFNSR